MSNFKSSKDRLEDLADFQKNLGEPNTFSNQFLDDCLYGIYPDDLILLTASTGSGKTEFVTNILQANTAKGKNVHLFALEAHKKEIEMRIKFKLLAQAFFMQKDWRRYSEKPNYMAWFYGKQNGLLEKFEPEIDETLRKTLAPSHTYYLEKDFTIDTFESQLHQIHDKTDLVILDHLHYFDFDGGNENVMMKRTIKKIKELTVFYRKPTIIVVHVRKKDKRVAGLLPEIDDIHGSSDVGKIANKIIATQPAFDQKAEQPHIFPTYFKVLKNRLDGSRCRYVGLCGFDNQQNQYLKNYKIGELNFAGDEFILLDEKDYPWWSSQKPKQENLL